VAPGADDAESLAARVEGQLDDLARRFDQNDWIEPFAAMLLALATIVAAPTALRPWPRCRARGTAAAPRPRGGCDH
jgi:hypothetical protein